jgi:hypothetical protein
MQSKAIVSIALLALVGSAFGLDAAEKAQAPELSTTLVHGIQP